MKSDVSDVRNSLFLISDLFLFFELTKVNLSSFHQTKIVGERPEEAFFYPFGHQYVLCKSQTLVVHYANKSSSLIAQRA